MYSENSPACYTAKDIQTNKSICKKMDIVTQYFGDEEDEPKINIMKLHKNSRGFPKNGNRKNPIFRFLSNRTKDAIKT